MCVIRKEQMEAMDRVMMKRFIGKSILFLRINFPEWSSGQSDNALSDFISTLTNFAHKYNIRKEINIQKLMEYKITFDYHIPLPAHLDKILKRDGFGEGSRIELFVRRLEDSSPLIELTLHEAPEGMP